MSKAIIVELNKHHAIVLAEGGSFIKVRRKSDYWAVGQEIDTAGMINANNRKTAFYNWKTAIAAAAAALLLFFQFFYPFTGEEVYASVSMDMEPSIELEINRDLQVINIVAYNAQGEEVLRSLKNWEDKPIAYVTKKIFSISSESGFVNPSQEVLITTTIAEDISSAEEQQLKKHVNSLMQKEAKNQNLEMTSIVLSKKEKLKAEKYGISPGQYAIIKAAEKKGQDMKPKDVQQKSLQKIGEKVGPVKELFDETTPPVIENKNQTGHDDRKPTNTNRHEKGKKIPVTSTQTNKESKKSAAKTEKDTFTEKPNINDDKTVIEGTGKIVKKAEEKSGEHPSEKMPVTDTQKHSLQNGERSTEKELPNEQENKSSSPQPAQAGAQLSLSETKTASADTSKDTAVHGEEDASETMDLHYKAS